MINNVFSADAFFNPDNRFYPVYSWMWNEALSKDEIKKQLDRMYERNIRGVYVVALPTEFRPDTMTTGLEPPYLSDGYFEMLSFAADYASARGMTLWLYDEGGWPSGNANGLVIKDNKKLRLKHIENSKIKVINRADLTSREATEKFIALTHQAHKNKMGDSFKKLGPLVFTDEPDIKALPFTKSIKEEYKKRTGKRLSAIKLKKHSDPDFNIIYHDICADVFAQNYFVPIKKWCNENGLLSAGHLDKDNEAYGYSKSFHHPLRQLRLFDVPGIDVIWGQIMPDNKCGFFPRLASSAAQQSGSGLSLTESLSVYGTLTYGQMRYILGYQLVRGINILNIMLMMYNEKGYYCIRQRPSFSDELPCAEFLPEFNRYTASLQYLMQGGKPDTEAALYLPMRSLWADDKDTKAALENYGEMGGLIEKSHDQFDIIDDDLILGCEPMMLKAGIIAYGSAAYRTVYIPADKYMPEEVKNRLEAFEKGGGTVYYKHNAKYKALLEISGDGGQLRVHKRKYDNCDVYLVFNEAGVRLQAELELPEGAKEFDALNKKIYAADKIHFFESGEIKIFVTGDFSLTEKHKAERGKKICTVTDFKIKKLSSFELDKNGMRRTAVNGEVKDTASGSWCGLYGSGFSGKCEYTAEFNCDSSNKNLIIALGEVHYGCEIIFNGTKIADLYMPPYEAVIDKALIKKHNSLVINVSNTAANAFVNFDLPDEWEQKHIGPYHQKALTFEKELISGGLISGIEIYESS